MARADECDGNRRPGMYGPGAVNEEAATHGGVVTAPQVVAVEAPMQTLIASIFTSVAELGVFFGAAIALTAGALALR